VSTCNVFGENIIASTISTLTWPIHTLVDTNKTTKATVSTAGNAEANGPFPRGPTSLTVIRDPDSATAENIRHLSDKRYVATHAAGCLQCGYYKRLYRKTISAYARKSKGKHAWHFLRICIPVKVEIAWIKETFINLDKICKIFF